jgi:hypothetical protein
MANEDLQELNVGGGQTGASKTPDPVAKKATLPNSKDQGEKSVIKGATSAGYDEQQDTDPENNTKATADNSASNKASVSMKEDMDALFSGEDLTEDFKTKATTIFEAAVHAKVEALREEMDAEYATKLETQLAESLEEITTRIDDYMNYAVNEWMEENEVAIESSLRNEISEEFIEGLKQLFAEHYIDIPEEKLDVLGEMAEKLEELEAKLNESVEQNIELSKQLAEEVKERIFNEVAEGLITTQSDKFKTLAEGVDYSDANTYKQKLEIVRENYFADKKKPASSIVENEIDNAEEQAPTKPAVSGAVANYVAAISRTTKK